MAKEELVLEFLRYVLPTEIVDYFELIYLQEIDGTLHLYLDVKVKT